MVIRDYTGIGERGNEVAGGDSTQERAVLGAVGGGDKEVGGFNRGSGVRGAAVAGSI